MDKEKQKIISNGVKNKKNIILGMLIAMFWLVPILSHAQIDIPKLFDIKYKPNVPIPVSVTSPSGKTYNFAAEQTIEDGGFLASYIVAIYTYAAGFAGIVAMFMLVIAAWRWLFAAGNASKIEASKDMVNGVLLGLAIIFGGQLLLRQISSDFDSVQTLNVRLPLDVTQAISDAQAEQCEGIEVCSDYKTLSQCTNDTCKLNPDPKANPKSNCIPNFKDDEGNEFESCLQCNSSCDCDDYASAWYKQEDRCDCDRDGLIGSEDTDGCLRRN